MASISTGDFWNINRIAELCIRCGVKPSVADILVEFKDDDPQVYCYLGGTESGASNAEEESRVQKVWKLLGLDESGYRCITSSSELDAVIDRALSLAPPLPPASRGRIG